MKISSVRLGHANNSSSTHSILFNATLQARESSGGDFQYGWDWFHLKSKDEKAKYLAALVYSSISGDMAPEHAAIVARELTGVDPMAPFEGEEYPHIYVDHQSVNVFPKKLGSRYLHHGFMREFVRYVRDNPKITIRGGNDNEDDPGPAGMGSGPKDWSPRGIGELGKVHDITNLPRDDRSVPLFARKDGDWWTLYNKGTGAKIRLSFNDDAAPYRRASKPELVDLKITDHCPYGCEFCYMSSTKQGKHADKQNIFQIGYALQRSDVFEVALGGGEPTLHPDFEDIVRTLDANGTTVNLTSFSIQRWNDKIRAAVRKHCRSFAISNLREVDNIYGWNSDEEVKGTLQIPLGCHSEAEVREALYRAMEIDVPVTFLGYKHFGRGETFAPEKAEWVLDFLSGASELDRFGADSLFVKQFGRQLKDRGISEKLMVNGEGAYSCYVDAVAMRMGPSSYTTELHPVDDRNVWSRFPYAA